MTAFALIHGSQHGAWAWKLLIPELEALGHACVAMDLPIDEPAAGLEDYVKTVLDALAGIGEDGDLVVVGHSLGGMVAPIVAARRPARAVVYLCGVIPIPGVSMAEVRDREPIELRSVSQEVPIGPDRRRLVPEPMGREIYYHDCEPALAEWAAAQLRPTSETAVFDRCPLERLPAIKAVSIVCVEDRVVSPDWSRWAAKERLGIECIELPGGHAPMLARPRELAQVLSGV